MSEKKSLILMLFAAFVALIFAYISQYIFGYQPCILCLYQRIPFFIIIIFAAVGIVSKKFSKVLLICCLLLLAINAGIAIYHVGVEQKIFAGPSVCSSSDLNNFDDIEELRRAITKTKAIRCDEPQFFFLNLSMAAWNFLYCATLTLYFLFNFQLRTNRFFTISKK